MKVESTGLACWAWDVGALRADELKEEEEPDRQDEAMVVSSSGSSRSSSSRVALLEVLGGGTPPFCASWCVAAQLRSREPGEPQRGCQGGRRRSR